LKDKHVRLKNEEILFCFTGKKGIEHSVTVKNKKLARIVRQCRDIPGKSLFQYYINDGQKKTIDSGMVNNYIKEATGADFTAKDFRTWAGSLQALQGFTSLDEPAKSSDIRKNIITVLDTVSNKLGNSRSICKKYYIHPGLIQLYEEQKLKKFLVAVPSTQKITGLSTEEKILLLTLKKSS
jgi:DNA topoisomerase I